MKRVIIILTLVCLGGLAAGAMGGDYHTGATLICTDCHIMHGSQEHSYASAGGDSRLDLIWDNGGARHGIGAAAPYDYLLKNEVNELCLTCHNNNSVAPDVFGVNDLATTKTRMGGGLNAASGSGLPAPGGVYSERTGHSLGFVGTVPGSNDTISFTAPGLECISCHAQHGSTTQYRNLLNRGRLTGKNLTYAKGTNVSSRDVFEIDSTGANHYVWTNVTFNEPTSTASAYGAWCSGCHTQFHGSGNSANMGGASGGYGVNPNAPWHRHPTADVNVGQAGASATFVSSLTQYRSNTNKVKTMIAGSDTTTATPSCMSCHKAHGNENPFGLIFMPSTGTITDNGTAAGVYKDLCKQCHVQG